MNFSTIAFGMGYLFVPGYVKPAEQKESVELLKEVRGMTPAILSMQAELMRFGYMLDAESLYQLMFNVEEDRVEKIAYDCLEYLKDLYGDGVYVTLFGDYPNTVMKMSEFEMFTHQIFHYLSDGNYSPNRTAPNDAEHILVRDSYNVCFNHSEYKLITPIGEEGLVQEFKDICKAEQSLTDYHKEVVKYFCENSSELVTDIHDLFPEEIKFKETLCIVASLIPEYPVDTITDVLRLAAYMSGIDISLPPIPKYEHKGWYTVAPDKTLYNFRKFKRGERRLLLQKIEDIFTKSKNKDNVLAEMKTRINKWIRLGEILHPGEYMKRYPMTGDAFVKLRNAGKYIMTYNGRLEGARKKGDFKSLISIYKERPGEFARALDFLFRKFSSVDENKYINQSFSDVISGVSTKVLYELIEHFSVRDNEAKSRYVFIKGARKPTKLKDLPPLDKDSIKMLCDNIVEELKKRFAEKDSLSGKIFVIDKNLERINLPKNMRSANQGVAQHARGTRLPVPNDTGIFRLYCRWEDECGNCDLDLSVHMFTEDFSSSYVVSWNCHPKKIMTKDDRVASIFSGDVRHQVGNCAEYIDVDVEAIKTLGIRYLVAQVNDYDGKGFSNKNSWAGIMSRKKLGTPGDTTWSPDEVTIGYKISSKCNNIIMCIVDIETMEMYVVDEDADGIPVSSLYVSTSQSVLERYINSSKFFNACNLIKMNVEARGGKVILHEKESFEHIKKEGQATLAELKEFIQNPEGKDEEKLEKAKEVIEVLDNTSYISFEDIFGDYTKLFAWMF